MAGAMATYPSLRGRVVLVTGGGSGIGAAFTAAFAAQGARVGFLDVAAEPSEALEAELRAAEHAVLFVRCDLRDIAALQRGVAAVRDAFGPIAVLINNAANDERHAAADVTPEAFDERIAVNLRHQFFAAQAVLPEMAAAGGGSIINLGSASWMAGQGGMAVYSMAKSAVLGLTRSLARDYGRHGVRVNAIAPGAVLTQRQKDRWLTPAYEAELMSQQCLKRHILPAEVARFALFLASDEASACTGQHYVVDGGWV